MASVTNEAADELKLAAGEAAYTVIKQATSWSALTNGL
jgi:molybdopterin-binding protein